jgi:hypothetical protein
VTLRGAHLHHVREPRDFDRERAIDRAPVAELTVVVGAPAPHASVGAQHAPVIAAERERARVTDVAKIGRA